MRCRSYSELIQIPTYDERLKYAFIGGGVGSETFGFDRWINQKLYNSKEWRQLRNKIIIRDDGCDLACKDRHVYSNIIIHHLNPITYDDIVNRANKVMDPENLICVSHDTHNYIHYGQNDILTSVLPFERTPNDTTLW